MKAVGIFGGTFDPIHLGHLICAQSVYEKRKLEKIIFIPCKISPHKRDIISSESLHRLEMIKLAIDDIPYFDYSDFEISKEEISYSVDTLNHFENKYDNLELIMGEDNFLSLDTWKETEKIIELSTIIVLQRNISVTPEKNKYSKSVVYLDSPKIDISATDIRERIKNNKPINFLVTEKVRQYIYLNNLYR